MISQRLKGVRALTCVKLVSATPGTEKALLAPMAKQTALRKLHLMTPNDDDDRDHKTDRVHVAPDSPHAPLTFPPSAIVPRLFGEADPNSWQDAQLKILVSGVAEIKASREAQGDIAVLLSESTAEIKARLDEIVRRNEANHSLVVSQLRGLTTRVGNIETTQETSIERLERLELDMVSFQTQVQQRLDAMTDEIASVKKSTAAQ